MENYKVIITSRIDPYSEGSESRTSGPVIDQHVVNLLVSRFLFDVTSIPSRQKFQQKGIVMSFFMRQKMPKVGLIRELNPGPLAPEARIIPLDQRANDLLH